VGKQTRYKISAAICSYNRARFIIKAVESVFNQSINKADYEVIVVDNNSTDNTLALLQQFKADNPGLNFSYYSELNQGVSYTRTRCVQEAAGEIVAFLDDDSVAESNWLAVMIAFFNQHPQVYSLGGKILPDFLAQPPNWFSRYFFGLVGRFDLGDAEKRLTGARYPCGANMAFRRSIFDAIGYFNTAIGRSGTGLSAGEEKDIYQKILATGKEVYYLPQAVVHHAVEANKFDVDYVKRHSMGIGISERVRIKNAPFFQKLLKFFEYVAKWGYAIVYGLGFLIRGQWSKFHMLERFRWWVLVGYCQKPS
jgi:glucosyl-dolichyl phosphate glucuronosyltransferase